MKIRDIIRKYIEYSSKKIEPYSDWSYLVDEYKRWLETEVEIKERRKDNGTI